MSASSEQETSITKEALSEGVALVRDMGAKLESVLSNYGPDVAELAIETSRAMALAGAFEFLFVATICFWSTVWALRNSEKADWHKGNAAMTLVIINSGIAVVSGMLAFFKFDAFEFIGIFVPEAYLAAKTIGWI